MPLTSPVILFPHVIDVIHITCHYVSYRAALYNKMELIKLLVSYVSTDG